MQPGGRLVLVWLAVLGGWLLPTMAVAATSLKADRTTYLVGETPVFTITGAPPNTQILWSSWKDGASTGEINAFYGHRTDAAGNWSSPGGVWSSADVGFWTREAKIGGDTARANFLITPSLATLTAPAPTPAKKGLCVTHWGGRYHFTTEPFTAEGAKYIQNAGSENIFLAMSSRYATSDYAFTNFGGPINNLTDLAKSAAFKQILDMPFKTYILAAFTFGNLDYLGNGDLAAEELEIADLTAYLLQTYQGTGKTFILKNWEGDWALSLQGSGAYDPNYTPAPALIQKMTDWLNARHAGVLRGRQQAGSVSGVQVADAAEFNLISRARSGSPAMLTSVIPNAQSDYIAYSSYESLAAPTSDLRRRLLDDIAFIRKMPGVNGRPLLISEYGFGENLQPDAAPRTTIASQAFLDAGIPLASWWEVIENDPAMPGLWFVRQDGTRSPMFQSYRALLGARNDAAVVSQTVPATMEAGKAYAVSFQLRNTGTVPWDSTNGYGLGSQNPVDNTLWGLGRVYVESNASIAPGQTKTFSFTVTAPTLPGTYTMQWKMVQERVEWFGTATPNVTIAVAANPNFPIKPAVGLNKFDLALQYLGRASGGNGGPAYQKVTQAMARKAIVDAKNSGVSYFRVSVTGYGPVLHNSPGDLDLWRTNPAAYWALLDEMMNDLNSNGIKIVPSFVWNSVQFPAMTGENLMQMVTDPSSKSYLLLKSYVSDFINRYKNHPALTLYELTNEFNLVVDMDMVGRCQINPPPWDPQKLSCQVWGNVSTDQMIAFTSRLAGDIRTLDPGHPISSGFGLPRASAEHLRAKPEWSPGGPDWTLDSLAQFQKNIADIHQRADVISVHFYNGGDNERFGVTGHMNAGLLDIVKQTTDALGKPLFVGEFGEANPTIYNTTTKSEDPTALFTQNVLKKIEALKIPFSAPWVWEFYQTDLRSLYDTAANAMNLEPGYTDVNISAITQTNRNLGNPAPSPQSPDTTAPTVVLTWPLEGSSMSSSQLLYAVASDNNGSVSKVEFLVDGNLKGTDTKPPFQFTLDTTRLISGNHQVTAKAYDAAMNSASYSADVTGGLNTVPVAQGQNLTTPEDVPRTITLAATDADPLTYTVVTPPPHGTLTGTAPALTYTPVAHYNGPDNFTFKANDGAVDSNVATISLIITPVNDPPVALPQTITLDEDTNASITLQGTDVDGDSLNYGIMSPPARGTLTGLAPDLTYTPQANYSGTDSFTFIANDGKIGSNIAAVSITVNPVNDVPSLILTKTASAATAKSGDTITFTIQYQNTGTGDAVSSVITDDIPGGTTWVPGSITGGGTLSGGTMTWNLGTVAAGATGSVRFQVTVN